MARKRQESSFSHPLVAVDLGSHSIRSMAVERTADNWFRVLGVETSSRNICIERGVVTNTSNASYGIGECLK